MTESLKSPTIEMSPQGLWIDGLLVIDPDVLEEVREWSSAQEEVTPELLAEHVGIMMSRGARAMTESRRTQVAGIIEDATRRASSSMRDMTEILKDSFRESLDSYQNGVKSLVDGDDSPAAVGMRKAVEAQVDSLSHNLSGIIEVAVRSGLDSSLSDMRSGILSMQDTISSVKEHLSVTSATDTITKRSAVKGEVYEDQMNEVLQEVAQGLGAEYIPTGTTEGLLGHSKKGDGVFILGGTRMVVEFHHGKSRKADSRSDRIISSGWYSYLTEAMNNRNCSVALGVAYPDGNTDQLTSLGPDRSLVTCDPKDDYDVRKLRFVVQTLMSVSRKPDGEDQNALLDKARSLLSEMVRNSALIKTLETTSRDMHIKSQDLVNQSSALRKSMSDLISRAGAEIGLSTDG